jgi:hypothetical protein
MEELNPNFLTATNCEAFKLTSKMLKEILEKAKSEERGYHWTPLDDDYWLPEKADFDYEIACPNFDVVQVNSSNKRTSCVEVYGLFESSDGNYVIHAFTAVYYKGEQKLQELLDVARMFAYLRFCMRDACRDLDHKWWSNFFVDNVVSNETTLIFTEDKQVANTWANRTFPQNNYNAWIGKCGEFIFATWAGECGLSISRVDLKNHPQGDDYDFAHSTLLAKKDGKIFKLDIKTFQIIDQQKRNWWNVNESCLVGEHRQDAIIFVVIDEELRMGKVVGYLHPDEIIKKSKYISPDTEYNPYSRGYYRVNLHDIRNPYYLRALLDSQNQVFNGLFFGVEPHEVITQMIKDYPLDPITAYYSGYNYQNPIPGGLANIIAKPTLRLFTTPNY